MNEPLLSIRDLNVTFDTANGPVKAVKGVTFDVNRGEILAIVGESGSGKSVSARATMRLLPANARTSGELEFEGESISTMDPRRLRSLRGGDIAMIFQEPGSALDPVYTVGDQIREVLRVRSSLTRRQAENRTLELLELVGIPDPHAKAKSFPHQLSGGQKQRIMIAMAISHRPKLLLADEPTTALDVTVQAGILDLLRELRVEFDMSILMITHNLGVVADLADRVIVMREGEIIETARVDTLFAQPAADYTRSLLAAVPVMNIRESTATFPATRSTKLALELDNVELTYPGGFGRRPFTAVANVSLAVRAGETLGLVGESGSGKSTITKSVIGLLRPSQGTTRIAGIDPYTAKGTDIRTMRRQIGMVFQDPRASLNPRMTVLEALTEPLNIHRIGTPRERRARALSLLDDVHLGTQFAERLPHELSGGQRQRVSIARALALNPALLVVDEPTSALDVSVQARVLALLSDLQQQFGFACLFVTHDLAVISNAAQQIIVLHHGKVVESGATTTVLNNPSHPYTRDLIAAVPTPDPAAQRLKRTQRASRG